MKTQSFKKVSLSLAVIAALFSCEKKAGIEKIRSASSAEKAVTGLNGLGTLSGGLIAYWPLDNCNNAKDLSGYGHHGTASNTTLTTDRFGKANGAFYFNGTNSYIAVDDQADLRLTNTDFTLSAWVKLDSYNASYNANILAKRISEPTGYTFGIRGNAADVTGIAYFGHGGGYTNAFGTIVVGTGSWHLVTSVYRVAQQQLSLYVDGVLDNISSGITPSDAPAAAKLYIGRDNINSPTNGYFFHGALDDIRIYNKSLTTAEIQELYAQTVAPATGLISYWPLDNCNNANDLSGYGHHGTASNTTLTTDRFGNATGAFYFNGTNSYIAVNDQADLRLTNIDFTLSAWVKLDSYNASYNANILAKRISEPTGYTFGIRGTGADVTGIAYFGHGGGYTNAFGTKVVSIGSWHLITSVYRVAQQQLSLYVDGVLDNVSSGITPSDAPAAAKLYIGRDDINSPTNGYFLHGALDDIRIYNRALTLAEVQQSYKASN